MVRVRFSWLEEVRIDKYLGVVGQIRSPAYFKVPGIQFDWGQIVQFSPVSGIVLIKLLLGIGMNIHFK